MPPKLPPYPDWVELAMQGVSFWIGYRRSLFRGYTQPEAALVAEMMTLIQANLPKDHSLLAEPMYKDLVAKGNEEEFGLKRADFVVYQGKKIRNTEKENLSDRVRYVFEVKRGSSTKIEEDLHKLYKFREVVSRSSTLANSYLIILTERRTLKEFINIKDGVGITKYQKIPECSGRYKVRRVVKAASSFKDVVKRKANYGILIQVF